MGRNPKLFLVLLLAINLSSCSLLDSTKRSLLGEKDSTAEQKGTTVPRAQYDDLLSKYEELKQKYNIAKSDQNDNKEVVSIPSEVAPAPVPNPPIKTNNELPAFETVDVFASVESASVAQNAQTKVEATNEYGNIDKETIDEQLNYFQKALTYVANNNRNEATKIFQKLSLSSVPAIRARAKKQTGDIFLASSEFDLALQVYEDILTHEANSGVVLGALKNLVICTDKLSLVEKKARYESLLKDIFEVGV